MTLVATSIGIVGLGYWGPNRLRVLGELEAVTVPWLCDLDADRLKRFAPRYPEARTTLEVEDVLSDPLVDAVLIATPASTHRELATAALRAGKHVFIEKPLAPSSDEALDIVALAEREGRMLMCGHTFIYSPPVRRIKKLIDAGELGDLHFISSSRVNLGPYRSDVSVISDLGPHDFSILRHWLGVSPARVGAVGRAVIGPGVADVAFVDLGYADGLLAHVELSWLSPSKLRRTVIVGSRKMLVYEDGATEPVRIYDAGIEYQDPETFGQYQLSYRTGDIVSLRIEPAEPIKEELADFVHSIRTGEPPMSDNDLAVDVIRTVEAAERSMADQGVPVAVEPRAPEGSG